MILAGGCRILNVKGFGLDPKSMRNHGR
jgi:hypothetical protein